MIRPLEHALSFFWPAGLLLLTLGACTPQPNASSPPLLTVQRLLEPTSHGFTQPFIPALTRLGVALEPGPVLESVNRDSTTFFRIVDLFYHQNPGFCPVEHGFLVGESGHFLTLTARGEDVRVLVYDLSRAPLVRFAFLSGTAKVRLPTPPCRS